MGRDQMLKTNFTDVVITPEDKFVPKGLWLLKGV